ncbi:MULTISPECIES: hypothetical protein [Methylobacterium]|jgi:hypothetical protein|uniref:Uncharacterized protein n=1 Tax=Methylobacterium hispanicum TaxID=270350 RepID=A0AAV4ZFH6_9HYPH|nr:MULTISPECIES: hypothetical protein [Methylobacterium]GJD86755.1 hypothetical protein BHAOGJBA_0251 [Methylobacterium hispanicum]
MALKILSAPLLVLALAAGGLSAAQAQSNTSTPGAPAGDSGGNASTGSTAAPSGK